MKFRGLIIAVVVLVALGGLLYWSNRHKPSEQSAAASSNPSTSILKVAQSAISQLTLTRKGVAPVTLVKGNPDKWQISAPQSLRADQDAVSGVLSNLSNLNADRVVEEKASDLKAYGLDDPAATFDITMKGNKERKLLLGDSTPAGSDVYAMLACDPRIFTIASYNKTSIDKGLNDLRDKRLLTVEPDKVSRIALDKKAQTIEFARTKDGWQILKPQPLRADSFAVDELARTIATARMDLGGTEDYKSATEFAKATPIATVTLTGDQGPQKLEVRKDKDNYFAKSSVVDGAYKVDANLGAALDKSLDDFRNKKLFDLGFEEPDKIELHAGAKFWFLTRNGSDWWSNGKKMDSSSVESLAGKLRDLTASGFPDSGFSNPDLEAIVTSDNGKRVEKVLFSKLADKCLAKREDGPSLYQLAPSTVTELTSAAEAIKSTAIAAK